MRQPLLKDVSGGNSAINDSAVISQAHARLSLLKDIQGREKNCGRPGDGQKKIRFWPGDNCDAPGRAG